MLQQALIAVFLAAISAQAAIFPDQIGNFQKTAPKTVSIPDQPLLSEFGLDAAEQAEYKSGEKRFTATAWRFRDSTGALCMFEARRPSGATPAPLNKLAVTTSDGQIFAYGNYVFQFTGAVPQPPDFEAFYGQLPKLEQSPLPVLMSVLPQADLIPNSERYVVGPESLERFEPRIAPSIAGFHLGTEAQLGQYRTPKGEMNLAIFNYPTPSIARERLDQFQKIPGAMAKRIGPLVAVTIDPPDLDLAERLLAQVKYEVNLTLNQKIPKNEVKGFAGMILNIFVLAGLVLGLCVIAGVGFGAFRILARKMGKRVEPDAMITLGLDGK